jgi:hypothetical protein
MPHGAAFSGLVPKSCSYFFTKIREKLRFSDAPYLLQRSVKILALYSFIRPSAPIGQDS